MSELINKDALIVIFKPLIKSLFDEEKKKQRAPLSTLMSSEKSIAEVKERNGLECLSLTNFLKSILKMVVL